MITKLDIIAALAWGIFYGDGKAEILISASSFLLGCLIASFLFDNLIKPGLEK
tara:strand:- start:3893 stop:4051 length:159 start_codon:yes stop_codon:yes gene_type:complete